MVPLFPHLFRIPTSIPLSRLPWLSTCICVAFGDSLRLWSGHFSNSAFPLIFIFHFISLLFLSFLTLNSYFARLLLSYSRVRAPISYITLFPPLFFFFFFFLTRRLRAETFSSCTASVPVLHTPIALLIAREWRKKLCLFTWDEHEISISVQHFCLRHHWVCFIYCIIVSKTCEWGDKLARVVVYHSIVIDSYQIVNLAIHHV